MAIYDMSNSLDDFEDGDIIYIPETDNFSATICKFAPVEFEQNGGEQVFVTERAIIKEGSNWNPYPDCEITYEKGCPVCLANEEQQEMLRAAFTNYEWDDRDKWHRTANELPGDDVVAGIWVDGEGVQYIALCFYEADDQTWYEANEEGQRECEVLKTPDYWIELPKTN